MLQEELGIQVITVYNPLLAIFSYLYTSNDSKKGFNTHDGLFTPFWPCTCGSVGKKVI